MDIEVIKKGITNPAMRELVDAILQTVQEVKSGKKSHNQGLAELSGYKQVVQIMALEVLRHRLPVQGFIGRSE